MPFVPQIRKEMLQVLTHNILPTLQSGPVLFVLCDRSLHFPHVKAWGVQKDLLPDVSFDQLQRRWLWQELRMNMGRNPFLCFVYEGVMEHEVGITQSMTQNLDQARFPAEPGRVIMRLPAPTCTFVEPLTPGGDGSTPFNERGAKTSVFCLDMAPQGTLAHIAHSTDEGVLCGHSLQFNDAAIPQMAMQYRDELKVNPIAANPVAQAQLFVLFSRIKRILETSEVPLSNTSWVPQSTRRLQGNSRSESLCLAAMTYIEAHLSDELSWKKLARTLDVSPVRLNQAFHDALGTTVMRYITRRRVEAAKLILQNPAEPVKDISQLVGFASAASFCGVFKRTVGMTPNEYRKQHQNAF